MVSIMREMRIEHVKTSKYVIFISVSLNTLKHNTRHVVQASTTYLI